MTYRDEQDALLARIRTLEAELQVEKKRREAADAEAEAARATADEALRQASAAGVQNRSVGGASRPATGRTVALLALLLALFSALTGMFVYMKAEKTSMKLQLARHSLELSRLEALLKESRANLEKQAALNQELVLKLRGQQIPYRSPASAESDLPSEKAETEDRDALAVAAPGPPGKALLAAREAYVSGKYREAIRLARTVPAGDPEDKMALQIIGASSCFLGDQKSAAEAWAKLPPMSQRYLSSICRRSGVALE